MKMGTKGFCLSVLLIFFPLLLSAMPREQENLNRAARVLNRLAIPFESRSLLADYGGFGSSLLVRQENSAAQGTFVFAVPLDAGFAVDTALALAEKLFSPETQNGNNPVNIIVAFLGNERNELPDDMGGITRKGLRDILTLTDIPENWALCYFEVEDKPDELIVHHGITGYITPLEVLEPLASLFSSGGIPWSLRVRHNEIYKLGLVEGHEAQRIAWQEEVNSVVITAAPTRITDSGEGISPEVLAELFMAYSAAISFPVLKADSHYFFVNNPFGGIIFFSERLTIALLLIIAAFFLCVFLFHSARHQAILFFHAVLFFKSFWIFAVLLPLLVVSLRLAGLFYSLLFQTFAVSGQAGSAGALLAILLAPLIFFLPSPLLSLIRFPARARFYGTSSVIFVTAGLFCAAFFNFSFVPVFLWAFFFASAAALMRRPLPVFFCILLIPLFALNMLRNIFQTDSSILTGLFLSPDWRNTDSWITALTIALLSLPAVLLVRRGIILLQKIVRRGGEPKPKRMYRLIIVPVLMTVVTGAMILQIRLIPADQIPPERRFIAESPDAETGIVSLVFESIVFQDTRIVTLHIGAAGSPIRFDVSLQNENGLNLIPVYSAPAPFEPESGGRMRFFLGENPPNPLTLELVVNRDFRGLLNIAAVYNTWDSAIDPGEEPRTGDYVLTVARTFPLH